MLLPALFGKPIRLVDNVERAAMRWTRKGEYNAQGVEFYEEDRLAGI